MTHGAGPGTGGLLDQRYRELEADFDERPDLTASARGYPAFSRSTMTGYTVWVRRSASERTMPSSIRSSAGVSAQGQLLTKDVLEREFSFGEVEWVI